MTNIEPKIRTAEWGRAPKMKTWQLAILAITLLTALTYTVETLGIGEDIRSNYKTKTQTIRDQMPKLYIKTNAT